MVFCIVCFCIGISFGSLIHGRPKTYDNMITCDGIGVEVQRIYDTEKETMADIKVTNGTLKNLYTDNKAALIYKGEERQVNNKEVYKILPGDSLEVKLRFDRCPSRYIKIWLNGNEYSFHNIRKGD